MQDVRSKEQVVISAEETALAERQERWRWLPLSNARVSIKAWNPINCLQVGDLIRLWESRQSKAKARRSVAQHKLQPDDSELPCEILKLNGSSASSSSGLRADSLIGQNAKDAQSRRPVHMGRVDLNGNDGHQEGRAQGTGLNSKASSEEVVDSSTCDSGSVGKALEAAELDVGFARVELQASQSFPKYEFYIEALDGVLTRDGAAALLEYLDFALHLPDVADNGLVLTYDLRNCSCPQLDLVSWIMHYISDPQREEAWQERCVCWKVIVQEGVCFKMAESVLSLLFTVSPPKCRVLLVTDTDTTKSNSWVCFNPDQEEATTAEPSMFSTISSGLLGTFFPAFPASTSNIGTFKVPEPAPPKTAPPKDTTTAGDNDVHETDFAKEEAAEENMAAIEACEAADCTRLHVQEKTLELIFAFVKCGFDAAKGSGYLSIKGLAAGGGHVDEDGLKQIMDFMDAFVNSAEAQQGFSITYDLRELKIPSVSEIMRVAEWGNEPNRQDKWLKLNTSCRVVVAPGFKFSMCKAVLKSFFFICPPVCTTYLLSDPDEPEDKAAAFHPRENFGAEQNHSEDCADEDPEANSDDGGNSSCGHSADASETTSASTCSGANGEDEASAKLVDHIDGNSKLGEDSGCNSSQPEGQRRHHLRDPSPYALPQHYSIEYAWIFDAGTA